MSKVEKNPFETITALLTFSIILRYLFTWEYFLVIGTIIGLLSLLFKQLAIAIDYFWFSLTKIIGGVVSQLLLSFIFFIVLVPIAMLYKIFNKSELIHKNQKGSLFFDRHHKYEKKDLENPW